MTTHTTTEAGLPIDTRFQQPATEDQLQRTAAALREKGHAVEIVDTAADARAVANRLLPTDRSVLTVSSETLRISGLDDDINASGRFDAVRPKLMQLREEGRFDEMRTLGAAPDVVVGSVHAVTEDGRLLTASGSGSQLGLLFTLVALREERADHPGRFDIAGFLSGAALALLLLGLDAGAREGWGTAPVLVPLAAGLALAAVFVVIELARSEPMIDLRLLKDRLFRTGNLLMLPASGALMGVLFLVPLLLQYQMGVDATDSGLVTMFQELGMMAFLPLAGRLYPRIGPRRLLTTGFGVIAAAQAVLITVGPGTTLWVVRLSLAALGAGMALTVISLQAASFAAVAPAAIARASSVFSTTRQVASAAGVAAVATLLTTRTDARLAGPGDRGADLADRQEALFAAYHDVFLLTTALALIGFLIALRVRDSDAITTMRPVPTGMKNRSAQAPRQ
ncbi:MFS transporter [Streptosporangium sandarakinum]|uniref:MFS transporter n=1 Tax=Streptosporangium sandarakinum TaxID=1260955 RepID=UPI0036AA2683